LRNKGGRNGTTKEKLNFTYAGFVDGTGKTKIDLKFQINHWTEIPAEIKKAHGLGLTQKVAASMLGLSERQVRRLIKAIREKGDRGIVHGSRARPSNRRLPDKMRSKVLSLYQER